MAGLDWQATQLRRLFAEALAAAQASRMGFLTALHLEGRVFDQATQRPATARQLQALRELIVRIAADGILTDGEQQELAAHLTRHGLTLEPPLAGTGPLDLEAVELPDL
ncbi:MAG: hypothetical protein VKQ33_11940 [Candidatus Sericytochromatia bacterium]|nr:hypothetical protein [Candidatus Sericytochromatia bacterium]